MWRQMAPCRGLLLLALLLACHATHCSAVPAYKYILVIDAGSTGTRLHAYKWAAGRLNAQGLPDLVAVPPSAAQKYGAPPSCPCPCQ